MEKKINIAKILKDCPPGTRLYSPLFGEVELLEVFGRFDGFIDVKVTNDDGTTDIKSYSFDGCCFADDDFNLNYYDDCECQLWPSKDCRDWTQFVPPTVPPVQIDMERERQIIEASQLYAPEYQKPFLDGALWADKHPYIKNETTNKH